MPIYVGWLIEINRDFYKLIRRLARKAASISPLVNTDRKGGSFPIMLQQFGRTIAIAGAGIVRVNAKHKLGRLHYVRATAEETALTCNSRHSDNRWKPSQNRLARWFSEYTPEGYATFDQFRDQGWRMDINS